MNGSRRRSSARFPTEVVVSFIDEYRSVLGVEPISRLLPIAPSTYDKVIAKRADVDRLSAPERDDIAIKVELRRAHASVAQDHGRS